MSTVNSSPNLPVPSTVWTDDPVPVGTVPKAVYLVELRSYLETQLKNHYHTFSGGGSTQSELPAMTISWTDPTITAGSTDVKAVHWNEVRNTLLQLVNHNHYVPTWNNYTSRATPVVSYAETIETGYITEIKASHVNELRTKADLFRSHIHTTCCECECTCTCTNTCPCQNTCPEQCCTQCWLGIGD